MHTLEEYKEARDVVQKQINEARAYVKEVFEVSAKELVKDLNIESFSWTQYTPYFNDGDACVFSVHSDYPEVNGLDEYGEGSGSEDLPEDFDYELHRAESRATMKKVAAFLSQFDDSDMEFMFGDHVQVTVTRDAIVEDEYEHD